MQNRTSRVDSVAGRMSDWITVALVCVCVCVGVKVGYSLLLGHVANPLTLAWILLTDPFSSNKHTSP